MGKNENSPGYPLNASADKVRLTPRAAARPTTHDLPRAGLAVIDMPPPPMPPTRPPGNSPYPSAPADLIKPEIGSPPPNSPSA